MNANAKPTGTPSNADIESMLRAGTLNPAETTALQLTLADRLTEELLTAVDAMPGGLKDSAHAPAWHPDPTGRYHHRWWDGHQWTETVSNSGSKLTDPDWSRNPSPPPGT